MKRRSIETAVADMINAGLDMASAEGDK